MPAGRQRHRIIWAFSAGYFAFYVVYAALIKLVVTGSFGIVVTGFELLPAAILGTLVTVPLLLTMLGWWQYVSWPVDRRVAISGLATAVIIATTTLAYGFRGVSIVFTLLLLRGGVLILAPIVDLTKGRHVRWFSWIALALSFVAIAIAFSSVDQRLNGVAMINVALYLTGYVVRLPMMTTLAKREDADATRRYFVGELLVACAALAVVPLVMVNQWTTDAFLPSFTVGALYTGLYVFGTLIYLDRRENTFCVPLNRASSLLAGVVASWLLMHVWGFGPVPGAQLAGAAVIIAALLFLSPAHHLDEWLRRLPVCLFVCSGNTCRSPMAEAIARAERERKFRVLSAGLTAHAGEEMTREAQEALGQLTIAPHRHAARVLTPKLIEKADVIFCMTASHRDAVIAFFPAASAKTFTLDPSGDVDDPIGKPLETYVETAKTIQQLVRVRFHEMTAR